MGFNTYFLMFGKDTIFQSRLQPLKDEGLDPDTTTKRLQIYERGHAFKRVMPLAMRNLEIVQ